MNANKIKKLTVGQTIWDDKVSGLHVRGMKKGPVFYLKYTSVDGSVKRPSLGPASILELSQARALAKKIKAQVLMGEDPKAKERELKAQKTINELWPEVYAAGWTRDTEWTREVDRIFKRDIAPHFGAHKPQSVSTFEVMSWHKNLAATTGNRALSVFKKFFDTFANYILKNDFPNPCARVKQHRERERVRFFSDLELGRLTELLKRKSDRHPRAVAFIYLLMRTGARPSAIEKADWGGLSISLINGRRIGTLEVEGKLTSKTGKKDRILLDEFCIKLLESLEPKKGSLLGIKAPKDLWNKWRKELNMEDVWMRDLRRTFATKALSEGVAIDQVRELLGHSNIQTTLKYAKVLETNKMLAYQKTVSALAS